MRRFWRVRRERRANVNNIVQEQYQEHLKMAAEFEQQNARSPFADHWKPEPKVWMEDQFALRVLKVKA